MASQTHQFYAWTTLEGRLEELRDRICAWALSENYASDVWDEAFRLFRGRMDMTDNPLELSPDILLACFEEALDTADHFSDELRGIGD